MPFDLGTFTCVALGRRPAPGRHPPLRPLTPTMPTAESAPTDPTKPKIRRLQDCLYKEQFRSHAKRI